MEQLEPATSNDLSEGIVYRSNNYYLFDSDLIILTVHVSNRKGVETRRLAYHPPSPQHHSTTKIVNQSLSDADDCFNSADLDAQF